MTRTPHSSTEQFSLRSLLYLTLAAAAIVGLFSELTRRDDAREAEAARVAASNAQTRASILQEVNAICTNLGRAPADWEELERLLGRPLPEVQVGHLRVPIEYLRMDDGNFRLYHWEWSGADYFSYDSSAPQAGWVAFYN